MPVDPGVTVVTNSRVFYTTREAAGASDARHSLRPLIGEGGTFPAKLAHACGEIAKLCLRRCYLKIEVALTSPRLRGEVGDGAQRSLRARGTIRESEPVEGPPHPLARCSRPLPACGKAIAYGIFQRVVPANAGHPTAE